MTLSLRGFIAQTDVILRRAAGLDVQDSGENDCKGCRRFDLLPIYPIKWSINVDLYGNGERLRIRRELARTS